MTQPQVTEVVVGGNPYAAAAGDKMGHPPLPFPQFGRRGERL